MNTVLAPFGKELIRQALIQISSRTDQASDQPELPSWSYTPSSHVLALDPDYSLVEGGRGAGKSFWWAVLASEDHRSFIKKAFPEIRIDNQTTIVQGYGTALKDTYPSKDILLSLIQKGMDPRHIWQAVLAKHLGFPLPFPDGKWEAKASWIRENPEDYEEMLRTAALALARDGKRLLILFDALDRLANDWATIHILSRALFQLSLDMRSTQAIRLKIFVRPDLVQSQALRFPDASKLRKADLTWQRSDLYALLFQRLANSDSGAHFRDHSAEKFGLIWDKEAAKAANAWILPKNLRHDEELQKRIFHSIAGPTMTANSRTTKRGYPYTWLVNHLMDIHEQVSPRSFLTALETAARENTPEEWLYPLYFKGIQTGVQNASTTRVNNLVEDYPWIDMVMKPLRSQLTVPCLSDEIVSLWKGENLQKALETLELPPLHLNDGYEGLLIELAELGILEQQTNKKIQIPDVYRIAFGFGRKGGVKPLK